MIPVPPAEVRAHSSLESEARELGLAHLLNEQGAKVIAERLYRLQSRYALEHGTTATLDAFTAWLESLDLGIPRTTVWRRLHAGRALHHGAARSWSLQDLEDAGQIIANGQSLEAAVTARADRQLPQKAEAARNGGTNRLLVSEAFRGDADHAIRAACTVLDCAPPEGLGALLARVASIPSAEFPAWLEGRA